MSKFDIFIENAVEIINNPGVQGGPKFGWRWLQIGEMTRAGDILYHKGWFEDKTIAPVELREGYSEPLTQHHHPVARAWEDEMGTWEER